MKFTQLKGDSNPSLVGSVRDRDKPIYRWHAYKHSFSKELVENLLDEFKLRENSWVLDPFVGSGTTLLTCKERSINAIGYDISPFAVFLANTKLENYSTAELNKTYEGVAEKILTSFYRVDYDFPDIPIINKAFRKEIWNEILFIKNEILKINGKRNRNFFLLALFSILESSSNTSKGGGFLRINNRRIRRDSVVNKFINSAKSMIEDLHKVELNRNGGEWKAFIGDARKIKTNKKFDAIITSPPYLNRHDYTRIYSLELILSFVKNNSELKKLRYSTLRSHVEAKKKFQTNGYVEPLKLKRLIKKIEKNGMNNERVNYMIRGYFEDMYLCLKEMKNLLKQNAKIALVISNVRFSGINIPVDEILGAIGEGVGLKLEAIKVARLRGNSSQQMRDYKRSFSRESVIIWKN
jgi:DNA modification methylase